MNDEGGGTYGGLWGLGLWLLQSLGNQILGTEVNDLS